MVWQTRRKVGKSRYCCVKETRWCWGRVKGLRGSSGTTRRRQPCIFQAQLSMGNSRALATIPKSAGIRVSLKSVRHPLTLDLVSLALPTCIWLQSDTYGDIHSLPYELVKYVQDALHGTVQNIPTPSGAPLNTDVLHRFLWQVLGTRCRNTQRLRCSTTSESSISLRTLTYVYSDVHLHPYVRVVAWRVMLCGMSLRTEESVDYHVHWAGHTTRLPVDTHDIPQSKPRWKDHVHPSLVRIWCGWVGTGHGLQPKNVFRPLNYGRLILLFKTRIAPSIKHHPDWSEEKRLDWLIWFLFTLL